MIGVNMVKTIAEFKDELKTLRREMREKGRTADTKLVASWVNKLIISLEGLTPSLGLMREELNQLAESEGCMCEPKPKKKVAKKKTVKKKAVKKRKK
jgi:hypothetical protein